MKKIFLPILFLLLAVLAQAQPSPTASKIAHGTSSSVAAGQSCSAGAIYLRTDTGHQFLCPAGTWVDFGTGGATGATAALDNLAAVNINASLLFQTSLDLGSAAKPPRYHFLYGDGTYGTASIKFTGTPTGARVATFPDSNTTIPIASQLLTFTGPTAPRTITLPDAAFSAARIDAAQTFTGTQAFGAITATGTIVQASASAAAFESGPNGSTNPVLRLVNSVASQADGISIQGNAAGSGTTITALSSGSNAGFTFTPKGTGVTSISLNALRVPDASGYAFNTATTSGVQYSGGLMMTDANVTIARFINGNPSFVEIPATAQIAWSNGAVGGTKDTFFVRRTAANVNLGQGDVDTAPVAQSLSVQSALAGGTSNTAGATFNIVGSLGKSTGVPGRIHLQAGALITASGTVQQTAIDRVIVGATKVLANNTPTAIVNVTDASNTVAMGTVEYGIEVFDGTNLQMESGMFTYQVINKGGVFSANTITFPTGFPKNTLGSGTLAVTWTITAANPAVLTLNANSSLTPSTGYPRLTFKITNLSQQAIAVQ